MFLFQNGEIKDRGLDEIGENPGGEKNVMRGLFGGLDVDQLKRCHNTEVTLSNRIRSQGSHVHREAPSGRVI
jgi:hypothetical protein